MTSAFVMTISSAGARRGNTMRSAMDDRLGYRNSSPCHGPSSQLLYQPRPNVRKTLCVDLMAHVVLAVGEIHREPLEPIPEVAAMADRQYHVLRAVLNENWKPLKLFARSNT